MEHLLSDSYIVSRPKCTVVYHDELLSLDADIATFYDFDTFGVTYPGPRGTVIVLCVIGANTVRIHTDSDEQIVTSMLCRGYVVTVAVHFTGILRREEIVRVTLAAPDSTPVHGSFRSKWDDTYWEFTSDDYGRRHAFERVIPFVTLCHTV